ncbi:hypothetical protein [Vallicoccus soli]|uniref:hypothetical protein n=1 Tax=Vallicoccus soli TaxID=2339232 RepID=UPI001402EA63|nr:hypothetical protein [Vallicoccus soli]
MSLHPPVAAARPAPLHRDRVERAVCGPLDERRPGLAHALLLAVYALALVAAVTAGGAGHVVAAVALGAVLVLREAGCRVARRGATA